MKLFYVPAAHPEKMFLGINTKLVGDVYDPILNIRTKIYKVSPDDVSSLAAFCEENDIPFRVTER